MTQQIMPDKQAMMSRMPARKMKPLKMPVFYAFIAAAVLAVILEQIFLPNLRENPGFLIVVTGTTIFSLVSLGLGFSGLRARMPKAGRIAVSALVWGFAFLTLLFLALPSVLPGQTANDAAVSFSGAATAPAKATESTVKVATATLTGNFNNQGAEPVAGKATLGKTPDGKVVLRFENFNSANGPDLHVYLSKASSPANDAQVKNGLDVGKLKATQGSLNYELDGSIDLSQYKSVVVYCQSFSVIFGYANLNAN